MGSDPITVDAGTLLYPDVVLVRGRLAHNYLERKFLERPELFVAAWLREDPRRVAELKSDLAYFVRGFQEAYDPGSFVLGLPLLRQLNASLRARLLAAVREQYDTRFQVNHRLGKLQSATDAFLESFDNWYDQVTRSQESAMTWTQVVTAAQTLHDVLADPELRCRWIP